MRTARCTVLVAISLAAVTACSGASVPSAAPGASTPSSGTSTPAPPTSATPPAGPTSSTTPSATATASLTFHAEAAMATVRKLAGEIGPREATSPAYRQAATWVEQQFAALGYDVQRQVLHVPSGVSWGVPVRAGRTWNVVAQPRGIKPGEPYLLVGAHLDTVPQAPGAEDNASGIGVVLEVARLAAAAPTRLPVVFVAFAAEEPRGSGERTGVRTSDCGVNRLSDHWSFELAGLSAARIGGTPYPQYHSARDLAPVVDLAQLDRSGRLLWAWLRR